MLLHRLPIETSSERMSYDWSPEGGSVAPRLSPYALAALLLCLDLAGLIWLAAASISLPSLTLATNPRACVAITIAGAISLLAAQWYRLYDVKSIAANTGWLVSSLISGGVASAAIGGVAAFALPEASNHVWPTLFAFCGVAWILGLRLAVRSVLRTAGRHGICLQRAIVVAATSSAARMAQADIERASGGLTHIVGKALIHSIDSEPGFARLARDLAQNRVDQIVIADFEPSAGADARLVAQLREFAVDVLLLPSSRFRMPAPVRVTQIGHVSALRLTGRPLSTAQACLKICFDTCLAFAVLVLCAPLLAAIALAVRLDSPGPVLFRQQRVGHNGALFRMWKFRTMYVEMQDATATSQTSRNDRRVTRVGRILRSTSLDELPQIINVLIGDMSIVGPRPHATGMHVAGLPVSELVHGYAARHRVRPGITGWAQVNGSRGPVETERQLLRRVALDCHYIECWSFKLELIILARTLRLIAHDPHAY